MGSPGVESRARVAEGRALGLGSVRAVPVEPACGPGQRVVEEPGIGGPEGPQANRSRSGVKAKVCNEERGGGGEGRQGRGEEGGEEGEGRRWAAGRQTGELEERGREATSPSRGKEDPTGAHRGGQAEAGRRTGSTL